MENLREKDKLFHYMNMIVELYILEQTK